MKIINSVEESLFYVLGYCGKYVLTNDNGQREYLCPRAFCRQPVSVIALLLGIDESKAEKMKDLLKRYNFKKVVRARDVLDREDFKKEFAEMFDDNVLEGHTYEMLHYRTLAPNDMVYTTLHWSLFENIFGSAQMEKYFTNPKRMIRAVLEELLVNFQIDQPLLTLRDFSEMIEYHMSVDWRKIEMGCYIPKNGQVKPYTELELKKEEMKHSMALTMDEIVDNIVNCTTEYREICDKCNEELELVSKYFDISKAEAGLLSVMVNLCNKDKFNMQDIYRMMHEWDTMEVLKLAVFSKELAKKGLIDMRMNKRTEELSFHVPLTTVKKVIEYASKTE